MERKNAMFFHLFLPAYCECDGDHSPEDCLKRDLDKMVKEKKPPTPRECFAAADLLNPLTPIDAFGRIFGVSVINLLAF